ncbi:MAG: PHP domain-containing protein [Treponema sp.]|uniref:PHP domain-containing protein n=1 Tax=Treponema sp. TaxID=166 RepID=UPI0025CE38D2|nr:PHP domain-containing protein [Treponema sp.]MBR0496835.1 PHP domain-containing protein [Treponema sp.]
MIDLHSHSSASDGMFSPKESAEYAISKKLKVWALTDHDTTDGLSEAAKVCAESDSEIIFVPGIEINIRWPSGEFHLLGMGLRRNSKELQDVVEMATENRRNRNQEIVERMQKDGIEVTYEQIEEMFSESQIGRPHFASFLMKIGKVKHRQDAFDRFLGKGRPYYVSHDGEDLDVAVEAIRSAGGIPVLAHPLSLYVSWGKMDETIEKIKSHGVEGLEAWHPAARINEGFKLEELAHKLGMFVTAGSDFHGKGVRADRHLGKTSGDRKIDDRFWFEELAPHLGDFDFRETEWCK